MIQTKATLKNYFQAGKYPTQSNYEDLIDSIPEGIVKQISLSGYADGGPGTFQQEGYQYNNYEAFSEYNPLAIEDIVKYAKLTQTPDYYEGRNEVTDSIILIVHNDGFFYGRGPSTTDMYVSYDLRGGSEGYNLVVPSERQNLVIPLGCAVAFAWVRDGNFWSPIGNYKTITDEQLSILANGGSIEEKNDTANSVSNIELTSSDAQNLSDNYGYRVSTNAYEAISITDLIAYNENRGNASVGDTVLVSNIEWTGHFNNDIINDAYISCGTEIDEQVGITVLAKGSSAMFVKCSDDKWRPVGRSITITPYKLSELASSVSGY